MLEGPEITQSTAQAAAVIRLTIPRDQIQQVMGPAIGELMAALAACGVSPAGPVYSYHHRMCPTVFDFEVGVPVRSVVEGTGRVRSGELPAARVARAVYRGPYEGLGDAWREFDGWIKANGHATGPGLWESYIAGPESSRDPGMWRTELNRPLLG
ncbi:MAG: GyrI-like domain-containing protein [Phycisphaeraceae bacterium]|nr:GyrI-like domain-containing protein [Phycisphaeraceae bacterium]